MRWLLQKILPSRARQEIHPLTCRKHYWLKRRTGPDEFYYWCWICGKVAM